MLISRVEWRIWCIIGLLWGGLLRCWGCCGSELPYYTIVVSLHYRSGDGGSIVLEHQVDVRYVLHGMYLSSFGELLIGIVVYWCSSIAV